MSVFQRRLYTPSLVNRYLLHRVWYMYVNKSQEPNFPGLRNLKETNDVVFILINIIKAYLELDTFRS